MVETLIAVHHLSVQKLAAEDATLGADLIAAAAWRVKRLAWGLLAFNLLTWLGLLAAARAARPLAWTGVLAYLLGLQHAFDADHIAAIDNVTRKLRQDGRMPVAVGFFFAVGHSAAVWMLALGLMLLVRGPLNHASETRQLGEFISRAASAGFLTVIGMLNLAIARRLWRQLRDSPDRAASGRGGAESVSAAAPGGSHGAERSESDSAQAHGPAGLGGRLFAFIYRRIDASWQMLPVGMIFGLGFDTATVAALFGISAQTAADGRSPLVVAMLLPLLFTAGMTLVDTADGVLMMKAYDWAMGDAKRKVTFNLGLTALSAGVALGVAAIDWLQLLSLRWHLTGPFWRALENLSLTALGLVIVGAMLIVWCLAALHYRRLRGAAAGEPLEQPSPQGATD